MSISSFLSISKLTCFCLLFRNCWHSQSQRRRDQLLRIRLNRESGEKLFAWTCFDKSGQKVQIVPNGHRRAGHDPNQNQEQIIENQGLRLPHFSRLFDFKPRKLRPQHISPTVGCQGHKNSHQRPQNHDQQCKTLARQPVTRLHTLVSCRDSCAQAVTWPGQLLWSAARQCCGADFVLFEHQWLGEMLKIEQKILFFGLGARALVQCGFSGRKCGCWFGPQNHF